MKATIDIINDSPKAFFPQLFSALLYDIFTKHSIELASITVIQREIHIFHTMFLMW